MIDFTGIIIKNNKKNSSLCDPHLSFEPHQFKFLNHFEFSNHVRFWTHAKYRPTPTHAKILKTCVIHFTQSQKWVRKSKILTQATQVPTKPRTHATHVNHAHTQPRKFRGPMKKSFQTSARFFKRGIAVQSATLLKRRLRRICFSVTFVKIFQLFYGPQGDYFYYFLFLNDLF